MSDREVENKRNDGRIRRFGGLCLIVGFALTLHSLVAIRAERPENFLKISPSSLELSDVQPGSDADAVFYIVNRSKHTVFVTQIKPSCSCARILSPERKTILFPIEIKPKTKIPVLVTAKIFYNGSPVRRITVSTEYQTDVNDQRFLLFDVVYKREK